MSIFYIKVNSYLISSESLYLHLKSTEKTVLFVQQREKIFLKKSHGKELRFPILL